MGCEVCGKPVYAKGVCRTHYQAARAKARAMEAESMDTETQPIRGIDPILYDDAPMFCMPYKLASKPGIIGLIERTSSTKVDRSQTREVLIQQYERMVKGTSYLGIR